MTRTSLRIASLAAPVMIAIMLLTGSPSVKASDQPSAANAEVKIDNFSFNHEPCDSRLWSVTKAES